jgi:hypothetical protein
MCGVVSSPRAQPPHSHGIGAGWLPPGRIAAPSARGTAVGTGQAELEALEGLTWSRDSIDSRHVVKPFDAMRRHDMSAQNCQYCGKEQK